MNRKLILVVAVLGLLGAAEAASAWEGAEEPLIEDRVLTLTVREKGWGVGGVSVDRLGSVYVADFGETVWKVTPEGEVTPFAAISCPSIFVAIQKSSMV